MTTFSMIGAPSQQRRNLGNSLVLLALLLVAATTVQGFSTSHDLSRMGARSSAPTFCSCSSTKVQVAKSSVQDGLSVLFEDDDDDEEYEEGDEQYYNEDEDEEDEDEDGDDLPTADKNKKPLNSRWANLDPKYRAYLVKKGQERAIANKSKRQDAQEKKRKMYMFVKEQQRIKKKEAKIQRPVPFKERTPLVELAERKEELPGRVISLTKFGAYVDIGTECDGLLHVSQLSTDVFVEHPRQLLAPGDDIMVRIRRFDAEKKKIQLTMLPLAVLQEEKVDLESREDRIALDDIMVDDELWGQIKRVTDYGAYVEVGASCDGWLHFMDHPGWDGKMIPSEFITRGDRIRVWVSDVDRLQSRLKLTANRPAHLPGPRRELSF